MERCTVRGLRCQEELLRRRRFGQSSWYADVSAQFIYSLAPDTPQFTEVTIVVASRPITRAQQPKCQSFQFPNPANYYRLCIYIQFQTLPQNIFISVCLRLWNTCWLTSVMRHRSDCRGRNRNNCCICICICVPERSRPAMFWSPLSTTSRGCFRRIRQVMGGMRRGQAPTDIRGGDVKVIHSATGVRRCEVTRVMKHSWVFLH